MCYFVCQDCEDLLSITPPQSVKIQRYIEHLETEGITRVKMYMVITTAYLIFWAPLFLVSGNTYIQFRIINFAKCSLINIAKTFAKFS